jgi:hypothetical protein
MIVAARARARKREPADASQARRPHPFALIRSG